MKKTIYICLSLLISFFAYAGGDTDYSSGNPELVHLPKDYTTTFNKYDSRNRLNGKQVAVLYANKIAMNTASDSQLGDGAIIVMEIYKAVPAEDGKFVVDEQGNLKKGKFAAIAVMEKNSLWPNHYETQYRTGDWGYAIYKADGAVKENTLDCQSCHAPMPEQDYLFSHASLVDFAKQHH